MLAFSWTRLIVFTVVYSIHFSFIVYVYFSALFRDNNVCRNSVRMRYVAAYLLAVLGGNQAPKVEDLKKILGSVGVDCDDKNAQNVVAALSGKNLEELIEKGEFISVGIHLCGHAIFLSF